MSADPRLILDVTPPGSGAVLDLGGGRGALRKGLEALGYRFINLDIRCSENGEPSVIGDAHAPPFKDASFDLVVSKDTLEHFLQPRIAVKEVHRVLKPGGLFIIWVPFMHPFHGDDLYRYTPLGLRNLLSDFEILVFESPRWVFTVLGAVIVDGLKQLGLGVLESTVKTICHRLDEYFPRHQRRPASFAAGYRLVMRKGIGASTLFPHGGKLANASSKV